jgi:hypothetical protein
LLHYHSPVIKTYEKDAVQGVEWSLSDFFYNVVASIDEPSTEEDRATERTCNGMLISLLNGSTKHRM